MSSQRAEGHAAVLQRQRIAWRQSEHLIDPVQPLGRAPNLNQHNTEQVLRPAVSRMSRNVAPVQSLSFVEAPCRMRLRRAREIVRLAHRHVDNRANDETSQSAAAL